MTSEISSRAVWLGPPPERRPVRTWQDAEHNAAAWMRCWGYLDAFAKPGGSDGGVDVRSARALGQVKYQGAAAGRPELQRLFGARGQRLDRQLLFFTGSSYTTTAVNYALENGIALFVYGLDGSMTAVNAPARRITDAARDSAGSRVTGANPTREQHRVPQGRRVEALRRFAAAARLAATDRHETAEGISETVRAQVADDGAEAARAEALARLAVVPDPVPPAAARAARVPHAVVTPDAALGPACSPGTATEAPGPRPSAPVAVQPKERRPGTGRLLLALFLAVIALAMPGSESFTPRPDRTVATAILLVLPGVLFLWGVTTRSRRRFWPTGLAFFLLDLPLAWVTNAQLWQGDASDLLLPTTPAVLCLLTAGLLIRWNTRYPKLNDTGRLTSG
ncbi:restriction endonuclease [Streptomyces sp. NBC_00868]|uniref:restriction endonuclease n=1 Tax=unclassified Streptomyces TaxID=2593676 RepID=UPI003247FFF7|nr:restriction endonuclease [Streptomyces sp. NBC_00868]